METGENEVDPRWRMDHQGHQLCGQITGLGSLFYARYKYKYLGSGSVEDDTERQVEVAQLSGNQLMECNGEKYKYFRDFVESENNNIFRLIVQLEKASTEKSLFIHAVTK